MNAPINHNTTCRTEPALPHLCTGPTERLVPDGIKVRSRTRELIRAYGRTYASLSARRERDAGEADGSSGMLRHRPITQSAYLARVTPELASVLAIHSESETFVEGTGRDVLCCDIKRNAAIEARRDCPYQCRRHAYRRRANGTRCRRLSVRVQRGHVSGGLAPRRSIATSERTKPIFS
jgi:hypothetical protein